MDQRAHDVEKDVKTILETRLALADKIETLVRQVEATVESTKAAALDAVDLAKDKAADFIEAAARQLNPSRQAGRRPWIMVGSAMALGLFAGLIEQKRRAARVYPYYPPNADGADVMPEDGSSHEPRGVYPFYGREEARPYAGWRRFGDSSGDSSDGPGAEAETSAMLKPLRMLWRDLTTEVAQERDRLQGAVLQVGRTFIQDVVRMAGQSLVDQLGRSGGPRTARRLTEGRVPYE